MYTIIELQTSESGVLSVLHVEKATWREAQKAYHEKMVYAAQSNLACYAVVILDIHGNRVEPAPYYTTEEEAEAEA